MLSSVFGCCYSERSKQLADNATTITDAPVKAHTSNGNESDEDDDSIIKRVTFRRGNMVVSFTVLPLPRRAPVHRIRVHVRAYISPSCTVVPADGNTPRSHYDGNVPPVSEDLEDGRKPSTSFASGSTHACT